MKGICPICGKEFESRNPRKIYCSDECCNKDYNGKKRAERIAKKKIKKGICPNCGTEWESHIYNKRFCTRKCNQNFHNSKKRTRSRRGICLNCGTEFTRTNNAKKCCSEECQKQSKLTVQRICENCGKVFWASEYQVAKGKAKFHSRECWRENRKKGSEWRSCLQCGKRFWANPSTVKSGRGKCCSRACSSKSQRVERMITTQGYVLVECERHPRAKKTGKVLEHILIVEQDIGRLLRKDERIHHLNGKREDNRIDNLEIRRVGTHPAGVGEIDMVKTLVELGYEVKAPTRNK